MGASIMKMNMFYPHEQVKYIIKSRERCLLYLVLILDWLQDDVC